MILEFWRELTMDDDMKKHKIKNGNGWAILVMCGRETETEISWKERRENVFCVCMLYALCSVVGFKLGLNRATEQYAVCMPQMIFIYL